MALKRKTLNFLPSIFRTETNRKFLGSTLDQLISEPELKKINGFIGRQFSPTFRPSDNYVVESTTERQNYQLEPSLVVKDTSSNIRLFGDYTDLLNKIDFYGGRTTEHHRMFESEYYSFNPQIDLDKFVNYSQYYWLPNGTETVVITARAAEPATSYTFTQLSNTQVITNRTGTTSYNPTIQLSRGTAYTLTAAPGTGNIWIQTEPGSDGIRDYAIGANSRAVYGVTNNGTGSVSFTVPTESVQNSLLQLPVIDADYAFTNFAALDNAIWKDGSNPSITVDGEQFYPNGRLVIFTTNSNNSADWTDRNGAVVASNRRRGLWQMNLFQDPTDAAKIRIRLEYVRALSTDALVRIVTSKITKGRQYRVNSNGLFDIVPYVTAPLTTLYYQIAGTTICGEFSLINEPAVSVDVTANIIGRTSYVSPSGVEFTNGLKVRFDGSVTPSSYQNRTYIVEGVGTAITLVDFDSLVCPEITGDLAGIPYDTMNFDVDLYDESFNGSVNPDYIVSHRASIDKNAWSRINRWVHIDTIKTALQANQLPISIDQAARAQRPIIEFKPDLQLFDHGSIFFRFVDQYFAPGKQINIQGISVVFDNISILLNQTFRTISSYGINLAAGQTVVFGGDTDSTVRQRVYRVNYLNQFNSTNYSGTLTGTISIASNSNMVRGSGTSFATQLRIGDELFESSGNYLGRVYRILGNTELLLESTITSGFSGLTGCKFIEARISLSVDVTVPSWAGYSVVVRSGENKGNSYYLKNSNQWNLSQRKTSLNQAPLFDVFSISNKSLSEDFPNSNFAGTKLFAYKTGVGTLDPVLGFPLSYNGIGNFIGDINFVNHYSSDTFTYKQGVGVSKEITERIDQGYLKRIIDVSNYDKVNVWIPVRHASRQYQLVSGIYDGITAYFEVGVIPNANTLNPADNPTVKIYINNRPVIKTNADDFVYALETVGTRYAIRINHLLLNKGDRVDILFFANEASAFAHYQVPPNLEFNPHNEEIVDISLGQMRNHLSQITQNLNGILGQPLAANNLRNLDYTTTSGTLLKHSAPVPNSMLFLLDKEINFIHAIEYAKKEYTRFKNKFVEAAGTLNNLNTARISECVDKILDSINSVKTSSFPWFRSDMSPYGNQYSEKTFVIDANNIQSSYALDSTTFAAVSNTPSNSALLVYKNGSLLVRERDYIFSSLPTPAVQIIGTLVGGDTIVLRHYTDTDGSFIPETPTKLGLYPKFVPERFLDNSLRDPGYVIQGHDGSLTPAYNDFRDDLILELEKRIYNNIKVEYRPDLFDIHAYIPGKFRTTDYSVDEFNQVLNVEFLKWAGANTLDYATNLYFNANDPFSYNYNLSQTTESEKLPGYWRAIYRYYYDTDRPHTHPWEMLGHLIKPSWWDDHYSWTVTPKRNALILAITNGIVSSPVITPAVINNTFKRSNFSKFVPVDTSGNLISPMSLLVRSYNSANFSGSFAVGDQGPVESSWRRTSEFAFAVQRAMALLKPAKYFGLLADTSRIRRSEVLSNQILDTTINRPANLGNVILNGEDVSGAITRSSGYINWILGYLTNLGIDAPAKIRSALDNLEINLSHKIGGFTDKQYITVLAEQFTPSSVSESVIIPDENYSVYLNRGVPVEKAVYSAVIVEKTNKGWTVTGYNQKNPYFYVIPSQTNGSYYTISVLEERAVIYKEFRLEKLAIPYGFEFNKTQQLVDFLVGYQRYLTAQGFEFEIYDSVLESKRDWVLSAKEFLTWNQQGWPEGYIIVLSPVTDSIVVTSTTGTVDTINDRLNDSSLVNINFKSIKNTEFTIIRDNGRTTISTLSGQTIGLADLNLIQYEHVLIFDNVTVFNDIIYKPELGNRQYRLKLVGSVTDLWDGELTPAGFIYNAGNITPWLAGNDYRKGDIVQYKGKNYTALQDISADVNFNFNYWSPLDSNIEPGLVPNFAQNSVILKSVYDIDNQPENENIAKFSSGLIGYRNRSYLEDLGMNQTTQSKFYQGYIKEKGTLNSVNALARGYFDSLSNEIKIYEEWGARLGEYGAIDSNPEITVPLADSVYLSNPIAIELLLPDQHSTGNLFVGLKPSQLLSRTLDYKPEIFLNRNLCESTTWKIELFGDGMLCGKIPDNIYNYSINAIDTDGNIYLYSVMGRDPSTRITSANVAIGDEVCFDLSSFFTAETLYYSIEPVAVVERPLSTSPAGQICFAATSMNLTENLTYRVDPLSVNEQPGAITGDPVILACRNDKSSGRTAAPPDYLLYQILNQQFSLAITTRSVTGSDSTQLLSGTDGVNGVWPDDIEADFVIINHGIADARNNVSLTTYKNNLLALRNRLSVDKTIIWVTPTPVNPALATWAQTSVHQISEYAEVMRDLAWQSGDYLVDAYKIPNWLSYLTVDGVHPSQLGYQTYAVTIAVVVKQAIRNRTRAAKRYYEDDLQTAGYPLLSEVDGQVFDITNYRSISSSIRDSLYSGYRLWVAKDFNTSWQVYRAYLADNVIQAAELDVDNKFVLSCSKTHNLSVDDLIAIRDFDTTLDSFYQVAAVTANTITVYGDSATTTYLLNNTVEERVGQLFDFQKLRFSTLSAARATTPKHNWSNSDILFIDTIDDDCGNFAVYRPNVDSVTTLVTPVTTVTYSNVYSIVGRDCANVSAPIVANVNYTNANIDFCVYSVDSTETLYWSIETPTQADINATVVLAGNLATYTNSNVITTTPVYSYSSIRVEEPQVDIESINNLYLYSTESNRFLTKLDLIDPAKGRVLGTVQQDIDFTTSIDPAKYRHASDATGLPSDIDYFWGAEQVGTYWWNMDAARFIRYEQGSIDYRLVHWGELFPGSAIEVYEWIETDYLPSSYVASGETGTPLYTDDSVYSYAVYVDPNTNAFITKYYYWVRGRSEKQVAHKRHSTVSIENVIANPVAQNIPYMVAVKHNSFAVYNVGQFLKAKDTVLYVSSQRKLNENIIHSDFKLLQEGNPNIEFPARIENKIIDSLAGQDSAGRPVPDPTLLGFSRIGLELAPRQTVVLDMFEARENVVKWANDVMATAPVARRVLDKANNQLDNFYAKQDYPAVTTYTTSVDSFADLSTVIIAVGSQANVLVRSDETLEGYWVVYNRRRTSATNYVNSVIKRQRYDVSKLWSFVDWYDQGFSAKTIPTHVVDNIKDTYLLELDHGDTVKVKNVTISVPSVGVTTETVGNFELYEYQLVDGVLKPRLVGLENGTIQIGPEAYEPVGFDTDNFDSRAYDYETGLEFRYLLRGLKQDIFVEELDGYYNRMMFYVIDYILSEQKYVDWFFKTSFISVLQRTQGLQQFPTYIKDRQSYYENYLKEVKPYRTKIREYILSYSNTDLSPVGLTDFDVPAYYDTTLKRFRSPNGEYPTVDQAKLLESTYQDWTQNHGYTIDSIEIANKGYGYFSCPGETPESPDVVIIRTDTNAGANAAASIQLQSSTGSIQKVYVDNAGSNYTQSVITTVQGNGATKASDNNVYKFRVVAKGTANTSPTVAGLYSTTTGNIIHTAAQGYTMHRIRRVDGQITFTRTYQIDNQTTGGFTGNSSYDLAYDLGQTTSDYAVVVYTNGDPSVNRFDYGLAQAMYRCGASTAIFGSTNDFKISSAYVLIGIPGSGPGRGIENYSGTANASVNSWASIDFDLARARIVPITATPRVYQLPTAFSFPVSPTVGNVYTYGNRSWTYSGTRWVSNTQPITSIVGEAEPSKAKLVARLTNKTIRKIRTTLKFDRVQYGTQVVNWTAGNTFAVGTIVSYQGQGYVVKTNMPASDNFNYAFVKPIGDDQLSSSRYYKDAYFDNANDRIMAFYQATADNNNVPKNIDRLVTGVQDAWATYNSTTQAIPLDTNLVGDTFGSNAGIAAGNITVVGGQFIDIRASHAPDELVPGIMYDSISIRTITSTSTVQGFRLFVDMNKAVTSTDFTPSTITTLAVALNRNDTTITVADGSRLSAPNPGTITPGIITVNGERIMYYTKVGNVLGQIRRGVGGTGIAQTHLAGSEVEDVSTARASANYNNYNP